MPSKCEFLNSNLNTKKKKKKNKKPAIWYPQLWGSRGRARGSWVPGCPEQDPVTQALKTQNAPSNSWADLLLWAFTRFEMMKLKQQCQAPTCFLRSSLKNIQVVHSNVYEGWEWGFQAGALA
jgi:hypothetical protein